MAADHKKFLSKSGHKSLVQIIDELAETYAKATKDGLSHADRLKLIDEKSKEIQDKIPKRRSH